jgi:hypothetical protein
MAQQLIHRSVSNTLALVEVEKVAVLRDTSRCMVGIVWSRVSLKARASSVLHALHCFLASCQPTICTAESSRIRKNSIRECNGPLGGTGVSSPGTEYTVSGRRKLRTCVCSFSFTSDTALRVAKCYRLHEMLPATLVYREVDHASEMLVVFVLLPGVISVES